MLIPIAASPRSETSRMEISQGRRKPFVSTSAKSATFRWFGGWGWGSPQKHPARTTSKPQTSGSQVKGTSISQELADETPFGPRFVTGPD